MSRNRKQPLLPKHRRVFETLGENLRLARLRRKLSATMVAERAGISRNTLYLLEKGTASSSLGTLMRVLIVLGLDDDFARVAKDDELGRRLQDAGIATSRKRAPKRTRTDEAG